MPSDVKWANGRGGATMDRRVWTVEDVKDYFPVVPVKIGEAVFTGRVAGRLNQFAQVTCTLPIEGADVEIPVTFQFSWDTICKALNTNRHLKV